MKKYLFIKFCTIKVLKISLVILVLLNGIIISSNLFGIDHNFYTSINDQAINSILESSFEKVNLKVISGSFTSSFYSSDYHTKKLAQLPRIFIIISETDSEENIRLSSFLFTQSSTST